jgi:hypothetical protein
MSDTIVEREDEGSFGRYVVRFDDGSEGEMTYRRVRDGVIAIDHTGVPRQHRGKGHAELLVNAGIADARREGTKIIPLCSYVEAQFRRHPEWADLRA